MANHLETYRTLAEPHHLVEGLSIRASGRLTGVHRDTMMRLTARTGNGCREFLDDMLRDRDSRVGAGPGDRPQRWEPGSLLFWVFWVLGGRGRPHPPERVRFQNKGVVGIEQQGGVFRRIRGISCLSGRGSSPRPPEATHPKPRRAALLWSFADLYDAISQGA